MLFYLITSAATSTWRTAPANNKSSKYKRNNENNNRSKITRATRTARETRTTTTAKEEHNQHNRSCLCVLWGGGAAPPIPPSSCFYSVVACFRFCNFLVSLRWCQDHGVNELVKKLRFHNASNIDQNGKSQCNMEGWSSKMIQISLAKSCKHHATWTGLSSKRRRCDAKSEVLSPPCRLTLQNAEYIANTTQTLFISLLFGLDGFASLLSSWLCKALRASWLHGFVCVHLFTATKATSERKSQARPTPKQRPQHQLLVCSSSYTTPNNNHNRNNNKKLLLRLQLQL